MQFEAQGFSSHGLLNAFDEEDELFKKTKLTIPIDDFYKNSNMFGSYVIYKAKFVMMKLISLKHQ